MLGLECTTGFDPVGSLHLESWLTLMNNSKLLLLLLLQS